MLVHQSPDLKFDANRQPHGLWTVRRYCNAGHLCSGTAACRVHFGIRRIVPLRIDLRVSSRSLAVRTDRSDLGFGGGASLVDDTSEDHSVTRLRLMPPRAANTTALTATGLVGDAQSCGSDR